MKQFTLRITDELHAELLAAAKTNGRAMNAEIGLRLQQSPALLQDLAEIKYSLALLVKSAEQHDFKE